MSGVITLANEKEIDLKERRATFVNFENKIFFTD